MRADRVIFTAVLISSIFAVVSSYVTRTVNPSHFVVQFVCVTLYFIQNGSVWKYIKNPTFPQAILISLVYITVHIGLDVNKNVKKLKEGSYQSEYILKFKKGYEKYTGDKYITGNSNFIFLWSGKYVVILPRNSVLEYQENNSLK